MKLIVLTVLLTFIRETVSQSGECAISGHTKSALGDDPLLVCTCTGSTMADRIWWCFQTQVFTNCEENQGLVTGSDYNVSNSFDNLKTSTSKLIISNIQRDDEGRYTCKSTNGKSFSITIVKVYADVTIKLEPDDDDKELKYGEDMEVTCTTDQANSKLKWKKGEQTLDEGKNFVGANDEFVTVNGGKLTIKDGNIQHAGTYNCSVEDSERNKMLVLWTKIDINADQSVKVTEGNNAEIICKARSSPKPTISWLKGNETADGTVTIGNTDDEDDLLTRTSTLMILNVLERETYTCVAIHDWTNSISEDILLRVRDKLAWLWPFLVVFGVSIILAGIFITLHFKEGQDSGDEEEDEEENPMIAGKPKNAPATDADA